MADNEQAFADLRRILAERDPLYRQAEIVVETSHVSLGNVVDSVWQALQMPVARA
jgi:shikimate kinase